MPRPAGILRFIGGHIRGRIIAGLLILLPLGATYLIIKFVFDLIDPPLVQLIVGITGRHIPGVGLVTFLVVLYVAGMVGSFVIGRKLILFGHWLADLIPIFRSIYSAAKQTVDALGSSNIGIEQNRVVLLDFPSKGIKSIGFATSTFRDPDGRKMVAVYIPTTPLPTSGYLALGAGGRSAVHHSIRGRGDEDCDFRRGADAAGYCREGRSAGWGRSRAGGRQG